MHQPGKKIAIAQTRPIVGPVENNLTQHHLLVELAAREGAGLIVFPELSLTGYEPKAAASLARAPEDACFLTIQALANLNGLSIAVGVPTQGDLMPRISTLVFRPHLEVEVHSKHYLHQDEWPYFEPGGNPLCLLSEAPAVALAICYELSVPQHAQDALRAGASVYVASVAKTEQGVNGANERLAKIASEYSIDVMMANCIGAMDGTECVGRSGVWNSEGRQLGHLSSDEAGVAVLDVTTKEVALVNAH